MSRQLLEPSRLNLRFTPSGGSAQIIGRIDSQPQCDASGGGWYYDDPANPSTIHICPSTCGFLGGGVVEVIIGCESVYLG